MTPREARSETITLEGELVALRSQVETLKAELRAVRDEADLLERLLRVHRIKVAALVAQERSASPPLR